MTDYPLVKQMPCANVERIVASENPPCPNAAPNVCKGCFLVQYCSRECQLAHWSSHKSDCKSPLIKKAWKPSWEVEKRQPSFITTNGPLFGMTPHGAKKYLWGNVPALDVLNHKRNEGVNLPEDLHLLFAASSDIRNIVKSLSGLPELYGGECGIVVNDRDFDIVARNAILLLIALHFEPSEATHMMLHIWYSALIPERVFRSLQDQILPLIHNVHAKIRGRPLTSLQSKTWTYGTRSLRLVLKRAMWDRLPLYLMVPDDLSMVQARDMMVSTTLASERKDYLERALYTKPPSWRVCNIKFRKDGILLPFGTSRKDFDTPNPMLYQTSGVWPMKDSADPLEGWPIEDVMQKAPLAKHDIYGSLFMYIQDVLLDFCCQIERHKVFFQLFHVDALELPDMVNQRGTATMFFDRIEVSNIGDRGYLGPETTLSTFGPLLKRKSQNPHATLLTLFLNAILEVSNPIDRISSFKSEMDQVNKYLPASPALLRNSDTNNADFLRHNNARSMFRNYDKLFQRFHADCRFEEIGRAAGLKVKSNNTIIEPWPMRIKKSATQDEFNNLLASGHEGSERYVEWESLT